MAYLSLRSRTIQDATAAAGIPIYLDPTVFSLGFLQVTWHGFFTSVGTLVGVWMAVQLATRAGYTEDETVSVAMWGIIGAIVGARLFHVVDQWDFYAQNPINIFKVNEGGLAIFGTVVGGPLAGAIYAWRHGINVPRLADVASIPLILGMGIGRIGDIVNGEHHGVHAPDFPLAVVYTHPSTLGEIGVPVHLAVGYEMVMDVAIAAFLLWLARGVQRQRGTLTGFAWSWQPRYPREGMLFWVFVGLYGIGRFFIEFYRMDTIFALGISQSQLLSVLSVLVAAWALVYQAGRSSRVRSTSMAGKGTEDGASTGAPQNRAGDESLDVAEEPTSPPRRRRASPPASSG